MLGVTTRGDSRAPWKTSVYVCEENEQRLSKRKPETRGGEIDEFTKCSPDRGNEGLGHNGIRAHGPRRSESSASIDRPALACVPPVRRSCAAMLRVKSWLTAFGAAAEGVK